jgi:hypothetical protein
MKRSLIATAVALLLAGCGTFDGLTFENRIACTAAGDKLFVVSQWGGRIGVSSEIAEADRKEVCK